MLDEKCSLARECRATYTRVKEIFFAATEVEPGEREAFLDRACRHDPDLVFEVRSLLCSWREEPDFLDKTISLGHDRTVPLGCDRHDPPRQAISPLVLRRLAKGWERYALEECVGAGGSSLVFRATDRSSGRPVAIKLLSRFGATQVARFRREARLQARVAHESVLELYGAGVVEGIPFLALEWVDGPSLMGARSATSLVEKVELVRKVALGLHAVHERGILHLDVKPANILVEWHNDGSPKPYLADFGIARERGVDATGTEATGTGRLAGTPAYVAPERLLTPAGFADQRSDVYALGVTFYQLLLGSTPFPAAPILDTLMMIRDGEIPLPRDLMPVLPADLEAIVMTCLAAEPTRRYPSAQALAKDLERFLEGRPLAARPVGRLARAWRKARSLGYGAGAAAAVIVGLLCRGLVAARGYRTAAHVEARWR